MNKGINRIFALVLLLIGIFTISCTEELAGYTINILSEVPSSLAVGSKVEISYEVTNNGTCNITTESETISLEKENNKIIITAVSKGEAKIIIECNEYTKIKKEININIIEENEEVIFDVQVPEITVNETKEIEISCEGELQFEITTDSDIIKIEGNSITALKEGTAIIKVIETESRTEKEITIVVKENMFSKLLNYAFDTVGTKGYIYVELPSKHPNYDCKYEWSTNREDLLDVQDGLLELIDENTSIEITCKATYNGKTQEETRTFKILSIDLGLVRDEFEEQFKNNKITRTMNVKTEYDGATVEWYSGNEEIFSNLGELTKPLNDSVITIYYKVIMGDVEEDFEINLDVEGKTINDIIDDVDMWIDKNVCTTGYINEDTILPNYISDYDVIIEWQDTNGEKLDINKYVGNPIFSSGISVNIKVKFKDREKTLTKYYKLESVEYSDKWDLIKLFTDTIASSSVTTYSYNLVNWTSKENGYIPFYDSNNSEVTQDILEYTYGKQRTNIIKTSTEYIVVHDTGNASSGANAAMHNNYIKNLNSNPESTYISWHYTVGDDGIYQHVPLDEVAYHAGDGSHVYGDTYYNETYGAWSIGGGNRNGIGIESCINKGVDYTYVMRKLAKLVAELLTDYNLGIDRVKQHNHFSGKNCPQVMRENNRWEEFLYLVKLEYFAKNNLKGVTFKWTSNSSLLDNTGKITEYNKVGEKVSYQVEVTYDGETRTYNYESVIKQR